MRIAAGVLLIVVAVVNILGGLTYAGIGGVAGGMGAAMEEGADQMGSAAGAAGADENQAADAAELTAAGADEVKTAGGILVLFGFFLLVLGGLEIAAGVCLFQTKAAMFVIIVSVLEILADIFIIIQTQLGIWAIVGIVAGVFGIIAGKSYLGQAPSAGGDEMGAAPAA